MKKEAFSLNSGEGESNIIKVFWSKNLPKICPSVEAWLVYVVFAIISKLMDKKAAGSRTQFFPIIWCQNMPFVWPVLLYNGRCHHLGCHGRYNFQTLSVLGKTSILRTKGICWHQMIGNGQATCDFLIIAKTYLSRLLLDYKLKNLCCPLSGF